MIKLIAIISMIIDHTGMVLYPGFTLFGLPILRILGRIAMPLFAYSIAKGFYYTGNKTRYFAYMFAFAIISQYPFHLMRLAAGLHNISLNIMVTWLLALIFLLGLDRAIRMARILWMEYSLNIKLDSWLKAKGIIPAILCLVFPILLQVALGHERINISIDFGLYGIILPALFYIPLYGVKVWKGEEYEQNSTVAQKSEETSKPLKKRKVEVVYSTVEYFFVMLFVAIATFWLWAPTSTQQYAVLAVLFIPLTIKYDKSIRLPKLFFYIFYPLHMAILVLIHHYG